MTEIQRESGLWKFYIRPADRHKNLIVKGIGCSLNA
jgi:hypothetical protein